MKPVCHKTIVSIARSVDTPFGTSIVDQIDEHIMSSSLSDEESEALEIMTRHHSACSEWREYRSGCVTASNMARVFTRFASHLKDNGDPSALVRNVMGYNGTQLFSVLISSMLPIGNINRRRRN